MKPKEKRLRSCYWLFDHKSLADCWSLFSSFVFVADSFGDIITTAVDRKIWKESRRNPWLVGSCLIFLIGECVQRVCHSLLGPFWLHCSTRTHYHYYYLDCTNSLLVYYIEYTVSQRAAVLLRSHSAKEPSIEKNKIKNNREQPWL